MGQGLAAVSGQSSTWSLNPIEHRGQGRLPHTDPRQGSGQDMSSLDLNPGNIFSLSTIQKERSAGRRLSSDAWAGRVEK